MIVRVEKSPSNPVMEGVIDDPITHLHKSKILLETSGKVLGTTVG